MSQIAILVLFSVGLYQGFSVAAAQVPEELIHDPDALLFNGKITTFEGALMNENIVFHQAMALWNGRVLAVGTDEEILQYKGPETVTVDLKGKTVLPGFVDNHNHPHEWVHYFRYDTFMPSNVTYVFVPGPDDQIREYGPDIHYGWGPVLKDPPREMLSTLKQRLEQAAKELGPGKDKWILALVSRQGKNLIGSVIDREWLDAVVPDTAVSLVADFVPLTITANSLAIQAIRETDPDPYITRDLDHLDEAGWHRPAVPLRLYIGTRVLGEQHFEAFKQSLKYVMVELAKYGATTIGNRVDYPTDLAAHAELARTKQAPLRVGFSHHLMRRLLRLDVAPRAFSLVGDFNNIGDELFWNIGVGAEAPSDLPFPNVLCTTARVTEKHKEDFTPVCGLLPGDPWYMREVVVSLVANRVRVSQLHGSADMTLDLLMDAVFEGAKRAGLTMEDIRKMRITFDHVLLVRPDQYPLLKEFGMIPGVTPLYLFEADELIDYFGPKIEEWMFPVKSFIEAGIPVTVNLDRIPSDQHPYFEELQFLVTRSFRGKVYNAKEAVDPATALKTVTTWSARYLMREQAIGNLRPGYLANLVVLDKDYFTLSPDQIRTATVLMTIMGGQITWLHRRFERELPEGYQQLLHSAYREFQGALHRSPQP